MPSTRDAPLRLPAAFRKPRRAYADRRPVSRTMKRGGLHTVCEHARCPNIGECYSAKTATFMILGARCTRRCHFCAVATGRPAPPDPDEPVKLAEVARNLGLSHVVITSVDRDDLPDGGAAQFVACIDAVHRLPASPTVEVLTPDFKGDGAALDRVLDARPEVFNHNIETVARLYQKMRPQSRFDTTTGVLRHAARRGHGAVKSGLMVGLGERDDEVLDTLRLLRDLGVHIVTIGQYLRPTRAHHPVARYVKQRSYDAYRALGAKLGFTHVFAGPFVRSSYQAKEALAVHAASSSSVRARKLSVLP